MKFFRNLKSKFRRRRYVDDHSVRRRSPFKIILDILLFPIRAIFLPFKSLGLFHDTGIEIDEYDKQISFKRRIQKALKWLVRLPMLLISSPFRLIGALRKANRLDALFVLPALGVIGFFLFVFIQVFVRGDRIENRYRRGAQMAIQKQDYELAKTYFKRIIAAGPLEVREKFQWAVVLAQTGEEKRAQKLFEELAPDDGIGYRPAHRLKALALAQQLGQDKNTVDKKVLRRHLLNSREPSRSERDQPPEILRAWTALHMATENYPEAVRNLDMMAEADPSAYVAISQIYKEQGKDGESVKALRSAEDAFRKIFEQDELNNQARVALASVLSRQKNYDEAERLLKQGVRLQPDALMKRSMSDFYVMRHDVAKKEGVDAAIRMELLSQAIDFDPNFGPIYGRLTDMFMETQDSPEVTASVKKAFMENVTGDNPTPMAHFALSTILLAEGEQDKAEFHLEQAYKLNENVVVVLNNLAWMLAHSEENPDLKRALKLSKTAVEQVPGDGRFRDTLGTIYMKMDQFEDASTEFQLALGGVNDKSEVHRKLAICYQELGMNELANLHRKKVTEVKENK